MKQFTRLKTKRMTIKSVFTFVFAFCFSLSAFAQSQQISGVVTDAADGSGIPGATVQVLGVSQMVGTSLVYLLMPQDYHFL